MIYIQSTTGRSRPHHFDCSCALYGALDSAMDYRLTSYEEVLEGKFDALIRGHLFVGSVEFMREVFRRIGKDPRLPYNSNRNSDLLTLGEARRMILEGVKEKTFLKPKETKMFSGMVYDKMFIDTLRHLPSETEVLSYDPFTSEIRSEWRFYVMDGKIEDCRNYSGRIDIFPDFSYANKVISDYKEVMPSAYTIDIGILEGGDNVVVEFSDMWAIGNYGVENSLYLRMLRRRYFEIVRGN